MYENMSAYSKHTVQSQTHRKDLNLRLSNRGSDLQGMLDRHMIHPFAPVIRPDSRVLVLGSAPSVRSVAEGFYYMHPQNRFWRVMGSLLELDMVNADIAGRMTGLLENGIALYDAIYECDIAGSSDSRAENILPANIPALISGTRICRIFCNGALAYRAVVKNYPALSDITVRLPSTSPANASFSLERLVAAWSVILEYASDARASDGSRAAPGSG